MTTTAPTDPYPEVEPPAGAEADVWEGTGRRQHRWVFIVPRCVMNSTGDPLRSPLVTAQAVQWDDGTLDDGTVEPPSVSVESPASPGLSSSEARELARALVTAADEIDGWVAR